MQLISIPFNGRSRPLRANDIAVEAIAGVIAFIGSPGFAEDALAGLNRCLPVSWWSPEQSRLAVTARSIDSEFTTATNCSRWSAGG